MFFEQMAYGVGQFCEDHSHDPKDGTCDRCKKDAFDVQCWNIGDSINGVLYSPTMRCEIPDEGRDEAGGDGVIADGAEGQDLHTEDRSGEWRPENGSKARADTSHEQNSAFHGIHTEGPGELVGQRCASLYSCSFSSSRPSEEMGHESANQNQGRHAHRDSALGVVNLVEYEVVACFDRSTEVSVHDAHQKSRQGKQCNHPPVAFAEVGSDDQRPEKQGGRTATHDSCKHANGKSIARGSEEC